MARSRRRSRSSDYFGDGWAPYVSVAERRAEAAAAARRGSKAGMVYRPVVVAGRRKIAVTTWGRAWCDHIESFHDYENRLPRGRSYVRNGAVVDLQISRGKVSARVSGSDLYEIAIKVAPCKPAVWKRVRGRASGGVGSLIELLEGRLSESVMTTIVAEKDGLLPDLKQVVLDCSCPDWARLCKHLAAVLYGIGARLDEEPELLFTLRGVDPSELVSSIETPPVTRGQATASRLDGDLSALFGIELADDDPQANTKPTKRAKPTKASVKKKPRARTIVTRAELRELGVPVGTISTWLHQEVLQGTDRRGVYRHTAESARRLRERQR